jgi:hypothetical protein
MRCAAREFDLRCNAVGAWEGAAPAEPRFASEDVFGPAGASPSHLRRSASWKACTTIVLFASVAVVVVGCQQPNPHSGELADFREVFPHQSPATVEHPKSVMVAQGESPVVFQVREPSVARVMDLTSGQEITAAALGKGELIYVSEDTGVFAGGKKLVPGPFAPGHRYGISIDTDSGTSWQTRTEAPHPAPPPATQVAPGLGPQAVPPNGQQ